MRIAEPDSTGRAAGPADPRQVLLAAWRLLIAVGIGLTGCSSIYHRSRMPPRPGDELKMRVEEAQAVERLATQAGEKLRADLKQGVSGEVIQTDFDRLEMLARELQRRVLAARDSSARGGTVAPLAAECERLQRRSTRWVLYVEAARHADAATQAERLAGVLLEVDEASASSNH